MNSSRRAFTLVEILVVLAVVGLLAAILFPVFSRVRAGARTSTCTSNLRQIGLALSLYKTDHRGLYPPCVALKVSGGPPVTVRSEGSWLMSLKLQPTPVCPDAEFTFKPGEPDYRRFVSGYASNFNLSQRVVSPTEPKVLGRSEVRMRYPSLTVAAFDARPLIYGLREPDTLLAVDDLIRSARAVEYESQIIKLPPGATRHQGGANYLFGDGHVKWYRPEQLSTARKNDGVNPGFGL